MNPIISIAHQIRKIRINSLHRRLANDDGSLSDAEKMKIRQKIIDLDKADRSYWIHKHK